MATTERELYSEEELRTALQILFDGADYALVSGAEAYRDRLSAALDELVERRQRSNQARRARRARKVRSGR